MSESRRRAARYAAAVLSAVVGILYLLVGLNVLDIEGVTSGEQAAFAIPAAVIHFGGSFVALRWDKRWLWITGTIGLALIILQYFNLASDRDPAYETWGIVIRIVQAPLLVALAYLAMQPNPETKEP